VRKLHHRTALSKINLGKDAENIPTTHQELVARPSSMPSSRASREALEFLKERTNGTTNGRKQPLCLEHLVITDGADKSSSTSFSEICELVAKPGLPHCHLVAVGAGWWRMQVKRTLPEAHVISTALAAGRNAWKTQRLNDIDIDF
jgi:hypothetical protein